MNKLMKMLLLLGVIAVATPSFAQVRLGINFGPPRARREVRGRPTVSGSVWIGGYYGYNDSRRNYDWVPGRWEAPPAPHQIWVAPRYRRNGNHYDYYEGSWRDNSTYHKGNAGNDNQRNGNHGKGNGKGRSK